MDSPGQRSRASGWLLASFLFWVGPALHAQNQPSRQNQSPPGAQGPSRGTTIHQDPNTGRRIANPGRAQAGSSAKAQAPAEPSPARRESLRRTIEKRRQRRAQLAQEQTSTASIGSIGAIVPWPMPPALVIRHTGATHDEINDFLAILRK